MPRAQRKSLSMRTKMEIINDLNQGLTAGEISKLRNIHVSTISKIKTNRQEIIETAKKGFSLNTRKRCSDRKLEMEVKILEWLDEMEEKKTPTTPDLIKSKARTIFNELRENYPDSEEPFTASQGWYERFKERHMDRSKSQIAPDHELLDAISNETDYIPIVKRRKRNLNKPAFQKGKSDNPVKKELDVQAETHLKIKTPETHLEIETPIETTEVEEVIEEYNMEYKDEIPQDMSNIACFFESIALTVEQAKLPLGKFLQLQKYILDAVYQAVEGNSKS